MTAIARCFGELYAVSSIYACMYVHRHCPIIHRRPLVYSARYYCQYLYVNAMQYTDINRIHVPISSTSKLKRLISELMHHVGSGCPPQRRFVYTTPPLSAQVFYTMSFSGNELNPPYFSVLSIVHFLLSSFNTGMYLDGDCWCLGVR